jgi:hypothetical protein
MFRWMMGAILTMAAPLAAQTVQMDFTALAEKAKSKTEIQMGQAELQAFKEKIPKDVSLAGVEAISVHAFEYEKAGDYPVEALEPLRKQVAADRSWSRVVSAREGGESSDIYVQIREGKLAGLLVIAAEPREVTVVQIAGMVELAKLQEVVKSTIQFDLASLVAQGK